MNPRLYPHINAYRIQHQQSAAAVSKPSQHLESATPHQWQLQSTFALEQLTELAQQSSAVAFITLMAPIFGLDIPPPTYLRLHQALQTGDIPNPAYKVVTQGIYPASYSNRDRTISIHATVLDCLVKQPNAVWELVAILLHEFGHHLDNVLRHDLIDKRFGDLVEVADDAHLEEGSEYAYRVAQVATLNSNEVDIATYAPPGAPTVLIKARYDQAMQAIRQSHNNIGEQTPSPANDQENFEAGSGGPNKSTHETIEAVLGSLGFRREELEAIYYGNWLRDYSQLLDPKIVRASNMAKDFPNLLSRHALTAIVDVLAIGKFSYLREVLPESYTVLPQILGVYRPSQHIDNPKVIKPEPADPASRDADFEPWVLPGNPLLEVDPQTSTKRYIQRSVQLMRAELSAARHEGRNPEGLRLLGSALHILEDYFAHSNFVELSLIKNNNPVLPWTSPADCKWELPIVTGTFGGADIIASLAAPIGEIFYSVEDWAFQPIQAGVRSERDKIILILLAEHQDEDLLAVFETYLRARDTWANLPISEYVEQYAWLTGAPLRLLRNAYNSMMQGVLRLIGNSVDDIQTLLGDDPNTSGSTDPSHSQLAKDHAEHPLHGLAASLASVAVKQVGQAMIDYWEGKPGATPEDLAAAYFVHPMDSTWQDEAVTQWADANPDLVLRSQSKEELNKVHEELDASAKQSMKRLEQESKDTVNFIFGDSDDNNSFIKQVLDLAKTEGVAKRFKEFVGIKQ